MEHFFLAECEFQSRYLLASLDEVTGEMQPPRFPSGSLDRAIHETRRGLKEASPQEHIVSKDRSVEGARHWDWTNYLYLLSRPRGRVPCVVFDLYAGQVARLPGTL